MQLRLMLVDKPTVLFNAEILGEKVNFMENGLMEILCGMMFLKKKSKEFSITQIKMMEFSL